VRDDASGELATEAVRGERLPCGGIAEVGRDPVAVGAADAAVAVARVGPEDAAASQFRKRRKTPQRRSSANVASSSSGATPASGSASRMPASKRSVIRPRSSSRMSGSEG